MDELKEYQLDHIGIATQSLDEGRVFYESLGFGPPEIEEVPTESVKVGMFELSNGSRIELLEPTAPESPIQKFLDKRGPGIHHVCLRVQNIQEVLDRLKAKGVRLIDETPRPGADNCKVAFVHPKSAGGVLIELSEKQERMNAI